MGILDKLFGKRDKTVVKSGRPDFSDVQSGASTPSSAPPGAAPAPSGGRFYTVVKGDSLSKIAEREYGDANRWRDIYEANRASIKNPNLIYPGQKLRIP